MTCGCTLAYEVFYNSRSDGGLVFAIPDILIACNWFKVIHKQIACGKTPKRHCA
jgi:hypothetical protein